MTMKNKCVKSEDANEEDRISALPDRLIQHILSLLPSTDEAIQTTILSKRWYNQWTRVPVLVFDSMDMSAEKFSRFIDNTLLVYNCSKIKKFHIQAYYNDKADVDYNNWDVKFRFAITRDVEELVMNLDIDKLSRVPKFFFKHSSYVKLHIGNFDFSAMPNRSISWVNLKELVLSYCVLPNQAVENILSGSPSLESFQFDVAYPATQYDIISKSLKKLMLVDYDWSSTLQINCPNLEELDLDGSFTDSGTLRLMNSSSSMLACLDFECENTENINNIIMQFKHVTKLHFGCRFLKAISVLNYGADLSPLLLNNKYLSLPLSSRFNNFLVHYAGIKCALRLSHVLEKLVCYPVDLYDSGENYWSSNTTVFNCLVSHLKIVEINNIGLSGGDHVDQYEFVIDFIEFLLKNARVLEKLVVRIKNGGKDFAFQVSQKLLDLPRCSQHATVKLLSSN